MASLLYCELLFPSDVGTETQTLHACELKTEVLSRVTCKTTSNVPDVE